MSNEIFNLGIAMISKKHTYSYLYNFTEFLYIVMALISILISLFLAYVLVASLVNGEEVRFSSLITFLGLFFAFAVWTPVVFLYIAYLTTDIEADELGLHILFLWKKYSIKWHELVDIKPLLVLGRFNNKRTSVVIVKNNLTFIYRLYGLLYGRVNQPAILIHKNISEYDILIRDITTRIKKNRRTRII